MSGLSDTAPTRVLLSVANVVTVGNMTEDKNVHPAGEGLTDEEMVEQVSGQTASDLKNSDVFEREADGATTETEAAKATADELAGDKQ